MNTPLENNSWCAALYVLCAEGQKSLWHVLVHPLCPVPWRMCGKILRQNCSYRSLLRLQNTNRSPNGGMKIADHTAKDSTPWLRTPCTPCTSRGSWSCGIRSLLIDARYRRLERTSCTSHDNACSNIVIHRNVPLT